MIKIATTILALTITLLPAGIGLAESSDPSGKTDYVTDCARCHGLDGKGGVASMRMVPGYVAVDLTRLNKGNGGQFPRQEVYEAIDGRKRFSAHFLGDMPVWGLKYREDTQKPGSESEEKLGRRISALVDYIESLQEK